jgi:hypothetical protein
LGFKGISWQCVNDPANETPDCLIETAELVPAQQALFH